MTQATYEFIRIIKKRKKKKLNKLVIILLVSSISFIVLGILFDFYIPFSKNDFNKIMSSLPEILYIFSFGLGIWCILYMKYEYEKNFDYLKDIKYSLVKDILEIMRSKQLPLEIVAPMISKDIEEHLAGIKHDIQKCEAIGIKVFTGVIALPIIFLLSEYFRNLFSAEEVKKIEFFEAMLQFITMLLPIGFGVVILVLALYPRFHNLLKGIMGENKFSYYLDVLHEIEINMECDKNAKEKIIY